MGRLFNLSMPMTKLTLQLLTAFPATGIAGLNHIAVGQPLVALLKVLSYGVGVLYGVYLNIYYPGTFASWVTALMALGPWYIFDSLQVLFDSNFNDTGFENPISIEGLPKGGGKKGVWTLTMPLVSLILAALAASGFAVAQLIPGMSSPDAQKYAGFAALGGGLLFGGVGLIGAMMGAGGAAPAAAGAAVAAPAAAPAGGAAGGVNEEGVPASVQAGGMQTPNGNLAPAITLASVLQSIPSGGSGISGISDSGSTQEGGKRNDITEEESITFLGLLGAVAVAGLAAAKFRAKHARPSSS